METLDHHDEQTLFAEAFQAALDAAEIHKVMGMIGVTEGELGQGVEASKDDIWKRVRDEHRRFQEVRERVLAAEAAARRRGPTQEVEEVLSELVERLEMEPKLAEGTVVLEVARDALGQLRRHYSYSGAPAELRESVSAALDALTILIAMTDEERTARPPLQVDQVATEVRSRIEARARLIRRLEQVLQALERSTPAVTPSDVERLEIRQLRDQLAASRAALREALTERGILPVLRTVLNQRRRVKSMDRIDALAPVLAAAVPAPRLA